MILKSVESTLAQGFVPMQYPYANPRSCFCESVFFCPGTFFWKIMMKLGFPCALLTHELFVLNVKGARSDQKFVLCVTQSSL